MAQSQTVALPKRLPLVTQPGNRSSNPLKDSRLVNCYAEKTEEGYEIEKRPGMGAMAYNFTGLGQGLYFWAGPGVLVAVSGLTVYVAYYNSGNVTTATVGTLTGGNGALVQFCQLPYNTSTSTYTLMINALSASYYLGVVNYVFTLTKITDSNYPLTTVPGVVYLDGTLYVMDNLGNIYGSQNLNDPSVWSSTNKIQANNEPDPATCLVKQLVYIVAIKTWTTQVFYDAGNATGSPLAPVPGGYITYGTLSGNTVQEIDGMLLWVTSSKTASPQVGLLLNLQFTIVSTPAVDRLLESFSVLGTTDYYSLAFKWAGHRFYVITAVIGNLTLVFDIDQKLWYQWTDTNGNCFPVASSSLDISNNRLFQLITGGTVYFMGADYQYPTDYGYLIPVSIYTPNFDAGVDRTKQLNVMRFNADQTPGSVLTVRCSDDDYQTWTDPVTVDLGEERPVLTGEGSFYRRAYNFNHNCPTALRIRSIDLQMDLGTL